MLAAYRIRLKGRVQGVGFRWFTRENARTYGINGYVRNLTSGDVEIQAEGDEENLKIFMEVIKKGPAFSYVEKAEVFRQESINNFDDFIIMH